MFGLFESSTFADSELGDFRRSRGKWRGTIDLGEGKIVPLVLAGSRRSPDPEALRAARSLRADYAGWRPAIERGLFEHFAPYGEGIAAGELRRPPDVWNYSTIQYLLVAPLSGSLTVEIGIAAGWDEEHTLGARFRNGAFVELNGSVLAP